MHPQAKACLLDLFNAAVTAARPELCLPPHLPPLPAGRLIILSAGKAAASMARAAIAHYAAEYGTATAGKIEGLVVTRPGYALDTAPLTLIEAGHPVPTEAGVAAARDAVALAASAGANDLVLTLISGGGSALWSAPIAPLTLEEKQAITRALLRSGATISEMNCVRKHLSAIKGGRLACAAAPAPMLTLAISDVPGDDPSTIASGPTVPDPTTQADARAILSHHRIELPAAAAAILNDPAQESPKPESPGFGNARYVMVATPAMALEAAATVARKNGFEPVILGDALEGEARDLARAQAERALRERTNGRRVALLSGGEVTVTIKGRGRGGPNQEYALALALELNKSAKIYALACDTDGTDGGSGAADDPAGAIIGPDTLARASALGLDPRNYLSDNNSTGFFSTVGGLVACGPTFTNVNDFRVILVNGF